MMDQDKAGTPKLFKYKELKVYASTEWLVGNQKKYRQVFDRYSTSYIYAELSFYNKAFDDEDWEVNVILKCFKVTGETNEKVCVLPLKKKVSRHDNIVFFREGWGNKKYGRFWKKGTYYWESWVEGEKVSTKYFYVEDVGIREDDEPNPYVDIISLKLYEGSIDDVIEEERTFGVKFSEAATRYIYLEAELENLNFGQEWNCEIFIKFYNNARELKGQVIRLIQVGKTDDTIKLTAGWGSNTKGSWLAGKFTAEVVFMDELQAVVPFQVGERFVEGITKIILLDAIETIELNPDDIKVSFDDLMIQLNGLIGLSDVKERVLEHANYLQFVKLRKEKGFAEKDDILVHSVFIGNPGTGKTTVAGMMGKLYKKMGLLTKGHVHSVNRVDLVGEYIGQTAPKVTEAIEKARGGVLFIDEAYSLSRSNDDSKDFGREVIEILVKEMSDGKGDLVVIVAGYPKEMKNFMNSNPGLRSRFKLYFEFIDYLPSELSQIGEYACRDKEVSLAPLAKERIDELIIEAYRTRDRTFGNARFVYDLIDKAKINLGLRIMARKNPMSLSSDDISIIKKIDVSKLRIHKNKPLPKLPVDHKMLKKSLDELDEMIGMTSIKEQISELVKLVVFYQETGKEVINNFFLHTVFVGNPGTGKTTVARILAKIYKALGILERGHMIETDRQGLVAGYVGQTAIKTGEKIDEAIGGVLFIDEAYALSSGGGPNGDFGSEAIQILLKRMEDSRGEFFVFVAGYPDNMEGFLKANPGLNSRFDKMLKFDDYSPSELTEIAELMLKEKGMWMGKPSKKYLETYLNFLHKSRDKYFGNARTVRKVVDEIIKNQQLRLASMDVDKRKKERINMVKLVDVQEFELNHDGDVFNRKTIGFSK